MVTTRGGEKHTNMCRRLVLILKESRKKLRKHDFLVMKIFIFFLMNFHNSNLSVSKIMYRISAMDTCTSYFFLVDLYNIYVLSV